MQQRMHSTQRPNSWNQRDQEEDGTDHTIQIEQEVKEDAYKFNKGEETVMESVSQIPKSELENMGRWLVNLAQQEGILGGRGTQDMGEGSKGDDSLIISNLKVFQSLLFPIPGKIGGCV